MKHKIIQFLGYLTLSLSASATEISPIIPQPVKVEVKQGEFTLAANTVIVAPVALSNEAASLRCLIAPATGEASEDLILDSGDLNDAGEPEITFYIDGKDERAVHDRSSETVRFRRTAEELPMTMGIYHTKSKASYLPFHSLIDELFIFRAALPPTHIQQIMQSHQP